MAVFELIALFLIVNSIPLSAWNVHGWWTDDSAGSVPYLAAGQMLLVFAIASQLVSFLEPPEWLVVLVLAVSSLFVIQPLRRTTTQKAV